MDASAHRRHPARACRRAGLLLALGVVAGCATPPQTARVLEERPPGLSPRAELTDVPFHAQDRYQCGPAALAMSLGDLGREVTPDELVDEVYVPEKRGSLRTEMRAAARARGAVPYPLRPDLGALLREIDAGRPVLVMQNLALDWWPQWHYAVAVGYDLERGEIVLRSGEDRRRVTGLDTFERTWMRARRWAQVVVDPRDPPATANRLTWLRSVRELEATGQTEAALEGYRAATERWPQARAAWMARGNAAYQLDRPADARAAFLRAVELDPEAADGWNNLAYTLADTGCGAAALDAARCAVRIAPDDPEAADTLDELSSTPQAQALDAACGIPACPVEGGE